MLNNGRKFNLTIISMLLGLLFGVYCVKKNTDLMSAGAFWAAVSAANVGYCYTNVKQKSISTNTPNGNA